MCTRDAGRVMWTSAVNAIDFWPVAPPCGGRYPSYNAKRAIFVRKKKKNSPLQLASANLSIIRIKHFSKRLRAPYSIKRERKKKKIEKKENKYHTTSIMRIETDPYARERARASESSLVTINHCAQYAADGTIQHRACVSPSSSSS